jgi:hypothetical protein
VLAAVRALQRFACVGETLRHALNALAEVAPDWLQTSVSPTHPAWVERCSRRRTGRGAGRAARARLHAGGLTWSLMQILALALGGVLVDLVGIQAIYWAGGAPLFFAGVLGLALLGREDFRRAPAEQAV